MNKLNFFIGNFQIIFFYDFRFTTDVITSCVFGLESNSVKNSDSILRKVGKGVFAPSIRLYIVGLVIMYAPKLKKILGLRIFKDETWTFFRSLVSLHNGVCVEICLNYLFFIFSH